MAFQYSRTINVPFLTLAPPILQAEIAVAHRTINVQNPMVQQGFVLDVQALPAEENRLLDAGELLPDFLHFWLSQVARLLVRLDFDQTNAGIISTTHQQIFPLSLNHFLDVFHSNSWLGTSGAGIVWGVAPESFAKPRFPVAASGAVFPIIESLGIAWLSDKQDYQQLCLLA